MSLLWCCNASGTVCFNCAVNMSSFLEQLCYSKVLIIDEFIDFALD